MLNIPGAKAGGVLCSQGPVKPKAESEDSRFAPLLIGGARSPGK